MTGGAAFSFSEGEMLKDINAYAHLKLGQKRDCAVQEKLLIQGIDSLYKEQVPYIGIPL